MLTKWILNENLEEKQGFIIFFYYKNSSSRQFTMQFQLFHDPNKEPYSFYLFALSSLTINLRLFVPVTKLLLYCKNQSHIPDRGENVKTFLFTELYFFSQVKKPSLGFFTSHQLNQITCPSPTNHIPKEQDQSAWFRSLMVHFWESLYLHKQESVTREGEVVVAQAGNGQHLLYHPLKSLFVSTMVNISASYFHMTHSKSMAHQQTHSRSQEYRSQGEQT